MSDLSLGRRRKAKSRKDLETKTRDTEADYKASTEMPKMLEEPSYSRQGTQPTAQFSNSQKQLSEAEIIRQARLLGLKIDRKQSFINHTYKVVPELKLQFSQKCKHLGIPLQDGMRMAMDAFIKNN